MSKKSYLDDRKSLNNEIVLKKGEYVGNVFENVFVGNDDKNKQFISMIPFVRNLIEYTKGQSSSEYLTLTSCLHLRDNTKTLTERDIIQILKDYTLGKGMKRTENGNSIYSLIMNTADTIIQNTNLNSIDLENKIVLSIAIRLLAEEYLKQKYIEGGKTENDFRNITSNQTGKLIQEYKNNFPNDGNRFIIEKVSMMTPEHIHINSFMFEPLIDVSVRDLVKLYTDCKSL